MIDYDREANEINCSEAGQNYLFHSIERYNGEIGAN